MKSPTSARAARPGADDATHPQAGTPWWRHPMMWLVVGGPLAVVIAGIATVVIAIRGADDVLPVTERSQPSEVPAMQGRNHAATPQAPKP